MEVYKLECNDCIKCRFEKDILKYFCDETGSELLESEIKLLTVCYKFVPFPNLKAETQYYIKRK